MSIFYNREITVTLSEDAKLKELVGQRKEFKAALVFDEGSAKHLKVSNAASPFAVDLDGVVIAKTLYVEANGNLDVFINGSVTPIPLRPDPTSGEKAIIMIEQSSLTSLSLTMPDASGEAVVTLMFAGGDT